VCWLQAASGKSLQDCVFITIYPDKTVAWPDRPIFWCDAKSLQVARFFANTIRGGLGYLLAHPHFAPVNLP
jgi:hypothetical protein